MQALRSSYVFLLIFLLLLPAVAVSEQPEGIPLRLYVADKYALNSNMQLLEDKSNRLTIQDVTSREYSKLFSFTDKTVLNLGLSSSTFWLRIKVSYPDDFPNVIHKKDWYLEIGRSQISVAELYFPVTNDEYQVIASDIRKPFDERQIKHVNSVFPVVTVLGQDLTLYLRIKSDFTIQLPITLWSPAGFAEKVLNEAFVYGVFYGSMLIILIYNLFIYISIRNVSYLFYVLYLGGVTLVEFIETGHCSMFFGGITTAFQVKYIPFYIWYTLFIALLFMRSFLNTQHYHPRIDPMIKVLSIIVVTNGVITFFADFHTAIIFVSIFIISIVPGIITFIYYSMRRGNENARFFFYAWFLNLIGMLIFVGVVLGIVPSTPLTLASMPLGILSEAILLAFALADRIKRTEKAVLDRNQQSRDNLYRYRSVFNNAIEGMYQMTLKGQFTITNPAMAKILGFDSTDALMESEKKAVSRCYADPVDNCSQLNKTGYLLAEVYYQGLDGRDVWANHSAQLICHGSGRPKYIEGTLIDITQRKEKEKIQREMAREKVNKDIARAASIEKVDF